MQLKKRVNDLSILKSSNHTILNQKIQKMEEENQKLKKEIEAIGANKKMPEHESSKPFLFGPNDEEDFWSQFNIDHQLADSS